MRKKWYVAATLQWKIVRIDKVLRDLGVTAVMPLVGRYATSMEMAGASLTLMPLDSELEQLLKAPAASPFWRV